MEGLVFIWNILRVCMASKIVLQGMGALGGGFSAMRRSDNKNLLLIGLGLLMAFYIHFCFYPLPFDSYQPRWPFVIGRFIVDCLVISYGIGINLDD